MCKAADVKAYSNPKLYSESKKTTLVTTTAWGVMLRALSWNRASFDSWGAPSEVWSQEQHRVEQLDSTAS
jgi:hypothetical protein